MNDFDNENIFLFPFLPETTNENLECELKLVEEVNSEKSINQSNGKVIIISILII